MTPTPRDVRDDRLLEACGVPYVYGAGSLLDALTDWPAGAEMEIIAGDSSRIVRGWDCSGFAQAALWRIGQLRPDAWEDLTAEGLAAMCDQIPLHDACVGDLAFYRPDDSDSIKHVMVVWQLGLDGRETMVVGASGGGRRTLGDDPSAVVHTESIHYRSDLLMVGRLQEKYRP